MSERSYTELAWTRVWLTATQVRVTHPPPPNPIPPYPPPKKKIMENHLFPKRSLHENEFNLELPPLNKKINAQSVTKKMGLGHPSKINFPRTPSLGKTFWIRACSQFFHSRDVSIPKEHDQFLLRNWLLVLGQIGWNDLIKPYQLRITVKSSFVPWRSTSRKDFRNGCVAIVFASIPTSKLIKWINTLPRKPSRSRGKKSMHLRRFGVNFTIKETIIKHRDGKSADGGFLGNIYILQPRQCDIYLLTRQSKWKLIKIGAYFHARR